MNNNHDDVPFDRYYGTGRQLLANPCHPDAGTTPLYIRRAADRHWVLWGYCKDWLEAKLAGDELVRDGYAEVFSYEVVGG